MSPAQFQHIRKVTQGTAKETLSCSRTSVLGILEMFNSNRKDPVESTPSELTSCSTGNFSNHSFGPWYLNSASTLS